MAAQSTEIDNISGATITTNAVKKAAASCIEQAMGVHTAGGDTAASSSDEDWLGTEPEIDESKVAKTVDVDVAVVGCGIAGVAACRSVAEDGGLVAAFEKADGPQCRSGEYAVINGKVQAKWGRDTWTREQIDDIIDSHMVESTYRCKRSIMSKWAHNIGDAFDWWVEANPDLYYAETTRSAIPDESADNFIIPIFYPLPEHYDWKQERFPCYPTSVEFKPDQHVTVEANMQKAVDTGNVQTFYGCFVEKLIMDHGRCVGLYARDAATGEYIKCNASKGVILSTGDYSQNTRMLKHFCPEVIENNIQCLFTNVDVEATSPTRRRHPAGYVGRRSGAAEPRPDDPPHGRRRRPRRRGRHGQCRLPEPRPQRQALHERGPARPAAGKPDRAAEEPRELADLRLQLA